MARVTQQGVPQEVRSGADSKAHPQVGLKAQKRITEGYTMDHIVATAPDGRTA